MNDQAHAAERQNTQARKTWFSILIAVLIIFVILGLTLIGGATLWIHRHINTQFTSADAASEEVNRERARFAGQEPLIELGGQYDPPTVHHRTAAPRVALQTLRVLAFDAREGKLVHVSIPFWILRLAPSKHVRIFNQSRGIDFDSDQMHLTVEDLENAGPGLVLDARDRRDGGSVLVWVE